VPHAGDGARSTLVHTKRHAIPFVLIGTMSVATFAVALESISTSAFAIGQYKPLPKGLLTQGQILFSRLRAPQVATVATTASGAARIAEASAGDGSGSRVVLVSLGGFVNKNQIIHDWIGTTTFIPKAVPSYVVRIFDPHPLVWTQTPSHNHYWNVVINAQSGTVILAFTYD
jgi:hypothetical protein